MQPVTSLSVATREPRSKRAVTEDLAQARLALAESRMHLARVIAEHERADEALRTANEEIEAGNQELQSTNEQLEASRQTIEATNEALKAVNDDLRVLLSEADRARAEATMANLAKSSFLANISHDLRTPLNAIAGYADLLELGVHGSLTPDQLDDVAKVKRSARYLLSLINDLLNFSTVDAGELDLRVENVEVNAAVNSLEDILHPILGEKGLSFDRGHTDAVVRGDADKIQQVLLNLASNAIKFTPQGGITVSCHQADSSVTIDVSDTGVGIAPDQLERIFEPFIQVNRSPTSVSREGVGLGLSISRELARAMGGDITVESVVGMGSTFSLTLPRAMPA